jgi:ABC-type multidrug transport system permease subunit
MLFRAEIRRTAFIARAYLPNLIGDQVLFVLGFVFVTGLFEVTTDGRYTPAAILASMIGWLTWRVAAGCMADTANAVAQDAQTGTLEHIWLSGNSPLLILFARSLTLTGYYSLRVLIMAAIIVPVFSLPISTHASSWAGAFLVFSLTLTGAFGLVFIITGLHLMYKNVSTITYALATSLLFLTGAIVSFEGIPILYIFSRFLPLSAGIDLLRDLLIAGQSPPMLSQDFLMLLGNTAVYLTLGWFVLSWAQKRALLDGSLAHY